MALLAWVFMQHVFSAWISPEMAKQYTAGLTILAAVRCAALVLVWSYFTKGDPACGLVQVAVNDLIMLVVFAPIVMFLGGVANVLVPAKVVITSVTLFIVVPLAAAGSHGLPCCNHMANNGSNKTSCPSSTPR